MDDAPVGNRFKSPAKTRPHIGKDAHVRLFVQHRST